MGAPTATTLAGTVHLDPDIDAAVLARRHACIWNARSAATLGARVGFVYKSEDDLIRSFNPGRPASAYTLPYPFVDVGPDGRAGTATIRR